MIFSEPLSDYIFEGSTVTFTNSKRRRRVVNCTASRPIEAAMGLIQCVLVYGLISGFRF